MVLYRDICESYYKDRVDHDNADLPWGSETLKYLEHIGVPTTDAKGKVHRRACVIVVGNNTKSNPRRTKCCHYFKRDTNFEQRLQGYEGYNKRRGVASKGMQKSKKAKLDVDSDDADEAEPEGKAEGEHSVESEVEVEVDATFEELCDRMSQRVDAADPSMASSILDTMDFDPLARMNLKAVAASLCRKMRRFAAGTSNEADSDDSDMTNAVAHMEMLHKKEDAMVVQSEKTADGFKPEEMTAEHLNACVDLGKSCNDDLASTTSVLLEAPLSEAEQERRQKEAYQRHDDQAKQLEEILTQCDKNVEECRAAAARASKNTEETMINVRMKTEAFLTLASRENQEAVNRTSDTLRTSKTVEHACKEELLQAEHEHALAKQVLTLFSQALAVRSDFQKMVAAGQYKQWAEEALRRYVIMLARALRAFIQASFLQQKQDADEFELKSVALKELVRKHGSTRATRQHFLESEIGDIQAGLDGLQRQRIQIMWSQQQLWTSRSMSMLTPGVKTILENCYRDILDMQMKKGDDHSEWEKIGKSLDEKCNEDTDDEPIV